MITSVIKNWVIKAVAVGFKKWAVVLTCVFLCATNVHAFVQTNFFNPHDAAIRLPRIDKMGGKNLNKKKFHVGARFEYGSTREGRNWHSMNRNILAVHDDTQAAIAMLAKPVGSVKENTQLQDIKKAFLQWPGDLNGPILELGEGKTLGRQKFTGSFREYDMTLFAGYTFPANFVQGTLELSAHMPIKHKEVTNIVMTDLTSDDVRDRDAALVRTRLTNNLKTYGKDFGGLDFSSWEKTGLGDLLLLCNWYNTYRQNKDYLKLATVHAKLGLSLPTGEQKDEDRVFSMPMGNDGAWGMPLGIGLELDFIHNIKLGIDADFLVLFDKERVRRLKTHRGQTEFLLLNKGAATREYGLTWQFHLYLQAFRFLDNFSARVAYLFTKRDADRLIPKSNDFSYETVNTAHSLRECNVHNIIFSLNYDLGVSKKLKKKDWPVVTQFNLFYKLGVSGKNFIDCDTIGGQVAIKF